MKSALVEQLLKAAVDQGQGVRDFASTLPQAAPEAFTPPAATSSRLDVAALSALPGRCGSCARWEEAPDWGPHMGTCGCPPAAWPGGLPPLAIHAGHRCAAYREEGEEVGRGYRAKGQASAPRPRPRQVTL